MEIDFGVGQQEPDDDQDGTAHSHDCFLLPAPSGDTPVTLTQERVGLGRADSGLAQDPSQVEVTVTGGARALQGREETLPSLVVSSSKMGGEWAGEASRRSVAESGWVVAVRLSA